MERGKLSHHRHEKRSKLKIVLFFLIIVVILAVGGFVGWDYSKDSICVTRSISGTSDKVVSLSIDTRFFNKPKSFMIEEKMPENAVFVSSEPKVLVDGVNGLSWVFWAGGGEGLKVEDSNVEYKYNNVSSGEPVGKIIVAINKKNPEEGYREEVLKVGSTCIK